MIAITAYTDIPVEIMVNEPPPVIENDEEEGQSDFALLLAGLLQDVQDAQASEDDSGLDALAAEKTKDGNKLNIFSNEIEKAAIHQEDTDIDPIDAALNSKHQNILSADHLFSSSFSIDEADDEAEGFQLADELMQGQGEQTLNDLGELASSNMESLSKEFSAKEIPRTDNSSANELSQDSSFITEKTQTDTVLSSQAASDLAAKQKADEASDRKANSLKDSQSSVNEKSDAINKAETLFAKSRANEENNSSLNSQNENTAASRIDEYRRGIRKDKVSLEVRDLRTGTNIANNSELTNTLAETSSGRVSGTSVPEVTLDLRIPDNSQAQASWEAKAPAALENMLTRELHQNFNGDIVRHASMILRNGGEGIIKLALHPETLGNVKIHLEMAENKITGFIEVESKEAMNAFRKEIAALEQAFMEQGFAEASLDLSFASDDSRGFEEPSFITKTAASSYEESYEQETASVVDVFFGRKTSAVNMLA